MPTATRTITRSSGAIIEVSLTRDVIDNVSYADGYNINLGRKAYERTNITVTVNGKSAGGNRLEVLSGPADKSLIAKGVYATAGDALLGKHAYDAIVAALAELDAEVGKSDEYLAIERAEAARKAQGEENERRMEAEMRQREKQSGWCKKCQDWTYGDCGHRN